MTDISEYANDIHTGDAADTLAELPESSIHMVMTSPPYFGLRDYGVDGQIGLEDELDEYIDELVAAFDGIRRVLRPDGSAWLNLGDSYAGDKNKMLVPHRVAIALQDDGWIVRNDVTWVKPNPMPSSVKDRLNTTTEQVFHLTPEPDYWYDLDAIREKHKSYEEMVNAKNTGRDHGAGKENPDKTQHQLYGHTSRNEHAERGHHVAGKNPGDVFEVTTKPFPEAHFAVYPPELCEKPIKATCPPKVCAECGSPYEREVERKREYVNDESPQESGVSDMRNDVSGNSHDIRRGVRTHTTTNGWDTTCDCDTDATEAGIALDPFAGAGTTCLVAKEHGRRFVGIDLNEEYVAMAQKRLGLSVDNPEHVRDDAEVGIESFL